MARAAGKDVIRLPGSTGNWSGSTRAQKREARRSARRPEARGAQKGEAGRRARRAQARGAADAECSTARGQGPNRADRQPAATAQYPPDRVALAQAGMPRGQRPGGPPNLAEACAIKDRPHPGRAPGRRHRHQDAGHRDCHQRTRRPETAWTDASIAAHLAAER